MWRILSHKLANSSKARMLVISDIMTLVCLFWHIPKPSDWFWVLRIHIVFIHSLFIHSFHSLVFTVYSYCHGDNYSMTITSLLHFSHFPSYCCVRFILALMMNGKGKRNLLNKVTFFSAQFAFASLYLCLKFSKWNVCPNGLSEMHRWLSDTWLILNICLSSFY